MSCTVFNKPSVVKLKLYYSIIKVASWKRSIQCLHLIIFLIKRFNYQQLDIDNELYLIQKKKNRSIDKKRNNSQNHGDGFNQIILLVTSIFWRSHEER